MPINIARLGTFNTYDAAIRNLSTRQSSLSTLQEQLTAGKRVVRPSDDPTAAAQAERAQTRLARVATDQRALDMQRNAITSAESTLGEAVDSVQAFRELVVSAGNGTYTQSERDSIAEQLQTLRDQIFGMANRTDSNGLPLFSGLGSAAPPFTDAAGGVQYDALGGQRASSDVSIPYSLDGNAAWMSVPTGNGVFVTNATSTNTGTAYTDVGVVTNPTAITNDNYTITFTAPVPPATGATTYDVIDTTTGTPILAGQPYTQGQAIAFDGMSITVKGAPANGDSFSVAPSTRSSIFGVLDKAIADIKAGANANGSTNVGVLTQNVTQALTQIDSGMSRLQTSRGLAGDLLNRADRIDNSQQARSTQLEADRSSAEDLDMIKGISDFQNQQTGYQAALQSYAMIQKLSLFNFMS